MINACRAAKRTNEQGDVLYTGAWFRKRVSDYGLIEILATKGADWLAECMADCLENIACLVTKCRILVNPQGDLGVCFPDVCTPREILIATVREATFNSTYARPNGVYGMDPYDSYQPKYSDANHGPCYGV